MPQAGEYKVERRRLMERFWGHAYRWRVWIGAAILAAAAWVLRPVLLALATQIFWAYLLMGAALPLCRVLERKLSPSLAATGAFFALSLLGAGLLLLLVPTFIQQFEQLAQALPGLMSSLGHTLERFQNWLAEKGIEITPVREELFLQLKQIGGQLLPQAAQTLRNAASGLSSVMLAPLLAFYLLRDRRQISAGLTLLVPMDRRRTVVLAAREMRREMAGFLRGQLLLSAMVGLLTGLGLMLVGTPGWLVLGVLMGVMELIPYIGPFIAGVPAVLLALQSGWTAALWTLLAICLVQQVEANLLSPRLLSGATRLHPLAVLLAIAFGGMAGGVVGMMAALPLVVCVRGAVRGWRE